MDLNSAPPHTAPRGTAPRDAAPHYTAPRDAAPAQPLQAVSLQDYEQLVTARAGFVDFLLRHADAA